MRILVGGGLGMKVGSDSKYWTLRPRLEAFGHEVRLRECLESGKPPNKVTTEDVLWAEVIVGYSYFVASTWHLWHSLSTHATQILIMIAGVPDAGLQQFYVNLWHAPTFISSAICYDVNDIPTSCTLQNPGNVDIDFGQDIPNSKYINVNCGNLFPLIMLPGQKHVGIIEKQEVIDSIVAFVDVAKV